ncbi:STAS domain-containing protein [Hymenobacter roseosalivarius]|uniref:STAS domain-containing protein n=1 Tax=Hymenobacter roseosalivarius TaxID=89967 RepID=UPI0009FFBC38|nr:STAS domain-containing protein [Hymenobacter roseosalivarius]
MPHITSFVLLKSVHPRYFSIGLQGHCVGAAACAQLDALLGEAHATHAAEIWLDCEQLADVDTQGLRMVFSWFRKLHADGSALHVCGLCPAVRARVENCGLAAVLPLLPADAFRGPRPLLR